MPVLAQLPNDASDHLLLVKPQFEVGRAAAPKGVVRDPAAWRSALEKVTAAAEAEGLGLVDVVLAEPAGPAGNREFFIHLRQGTTSNRSAIEREISEAGS